MNRALRARLKKLESARGDVRDDLTDEQLEARIEALAVDLGGFDAMLAGLDDSDPTDRRTRELTQSYLEARRQRSHDRQGGGATESAS
jgi:hypothetical protein